MANVRTVTFIAKAAIIASLFLCLCDRPVMAMTSDEIESLLVSYTEPGYKFIETMSPGMWKTLYSRPGWKFGWEVIVAATADTPENSFIVIGATVLSAKTLSPELMLQLLIENSVDTNPGNYSVFPANGMYSVQYAVKIPQTLLNADLLKEGIGFVAGYSNGHVAALEKLLAAREKPAKITSEPVVEEAPAEEKALQQK
jgi:hypothetical protein